MQTPTIELSQHDINFYHREGYLAVPAITTAEEVAWLRAIYDRLFVQQAGRAEGNQFDLAGADEEDKTATLPQILNPKKYAPELAEGLFRVNALAIAKQLLGSEAQAGGEHAILKPARYGAATPWHQDEAYWNPELEYNSISVWMPLQDVTAASGCMHFIPGTHRQEVQPHHPIGHDPRIHGLEIDEIEPAKAVACPIPAGGVTIHHCRTFHYAGPNLTAAPRRAYILIFALPTKPRSEKRNFYWQTIQRTARMERRRTAEAAKQSIA
jgi:ectoine hydroxylase-related dioxygenase (phytanoyl-CoA dioxygenase family)